MIWTVIQHWKFVYFGAVKLAKNADIDKYKYSRYGIGFDRKGIFSHPSGRTGRSIIIIGVDMSLSPHIDNIRLDSEDSEILASPLCLENISKTNNMT